MIIKNLSQLNDHVGDLEEWAHRERELGARVYSDNKGVMVIPYVELEPEGSTHAPRWMWFPFTLNQLEHLLEIADEATYRWNEDHPYCAEWIEEVNGRDPWYRFYDLPGGNVGFCISLEQELFDPFTEEETRQWNCLWRGSDRTVANEMYHVMLTRCFEDVCPHLLVEETSEPEEELEQRGYSLRLEAL